MGYAARAVKDSSYAPRRRWTVWRLRERAVEAWGDGSYEQRDATAGESDSDLSEADLLDDLGDRICRMAAHIHAATAHFLELVAEFDRRRGWKAGGHRSCAHWLVVRTGYTLRTARGYVRVARALEDLPQTGEAMARGRLSFCQVRALTRVATPETENDLLELAEGCTVSTLERRLRAWRQGGREDEAARERALHRSLRLVVVPDDDGGYVVHGRLGPEVGAVFKRALEAAEDALYRNERNAGAGAGDGSCEPRAADREAVAAANRRRADAVGLLAERALAAGFGGEGEESEDAPVSGSRAERYQMFVHVDADTLAEEGEPGRSELEDGWTVQWWGEGRPCFTDPRGGHHLDVGWQPPELPADPVENLVRENRLRGADPEPLTAGARWKREGDVPDRVWFGATEALVIALETGSGRSPA